MESVQEQGQEMEYSCKDRKEERTKGWKMCLALRQRIQKTEAR